MSNFFDSLKKVRIPFFSKLNVYIDLGTSTTRIAIKDKGIVLKEPSFIGFNNKTKEAIFFGREAKSIVGKTPEFIKTFKPLNNGIINDFDAEVALIKYLLNKSISPFINNHYLLKLPINALTVFPVIATEIEQKAVEEVLIKAGCYSATLIDKPLATAAGCKIDIFANKPHMIVDMGGGIIEISIISSGGIVSGKTLKLAGENMDKIISNYIYLKHGIIIGETTGEKLKTTILNFTNEEKILLIRGKSLETGLPKSVKIKTSEIKEALLTAFNQIIEAIRELMEVSPPETVEEVYDGGIYFTGGLAEIPGVNKFFEEELKIKAVHSTNFRDATINGLIELDRNSSLIKKISSFRFV